MYTISTMCMSIIIINALKLLYLFESTNLENQGIIFYSELILWHLSQWCTMLFFISCKCFLASVGIWFRKIIYNPSTKELHMSRWTKIFCRIETPPFAFTKNHIHMKPLHWLPAYFWMLFKINQSAKRLIKQRAIVDIRT